MSVPAIRSDLLRCRLCGKWRSKFEVAGASIRGYTCRYCLEWHFHALDVLGGQAQPQGCQECGRQTEEMKEVLPTGEVTVRFYCVPKDGIYQLLCARCTPAYAGKRKDMYGGTAYGQSLKL
jgi:predicted nucleic-acid-binding Zn-ribbon protein